MGYLSTTTFREAPRRLKRIIPRVRENGGSSKEAARLCAELYERRQKALDALSVVMSLELRRALFRKFSRSPFRDGTIPLTDIAETIEDLKP